jgi:hypothetical protein
MTEEQHPFDNFTRERRIVSEDFAHWISRLEKIHN